MMDLLDHVLEGPLERPPRGDLVVERFHDGEQVAVEGDGRAAGRLDGTHTQALGVAKLLTAVGSSACISMKFCAPVIESIVSTRFWTPESLRCPPALVACRYKSIRQPMVALST